MLGHLHGAGDVLQAEAKAASSASYPSVGGEKRPPMPEAQPFTIHISFILFKWAFLFEI